MADKLKDPSRIDLLELDIDMQLIDLWREAQDVVEWDLNIVALYIRAAYGKGYMDACYEEARGEKGSFLRKNSYRYPTAAQAKKRNPA